MDLKALAALMKILEDKYIALCIFSFIQRITFNKNIEIKELVFFKIRYRVFELLKAEILVVPLVTVDHSKYCNVSFKSTNLNQSVLVYNGIWFMQVLEKY